MPASAGVHDQYLDVLVNLRLIYIEGELRVSDRFQDDPHISSKVSGAVLRMMRYQGFYEGRFKSVGVVSQAVTGSVLVGVEELVRLTREDEKETDYYLHGFGHYCGGQVDAFMALAREQFSSTS